MAQTKAKPLDDADLVLETERLRLRPVTLDDLDLAREMFTDPEVMKFVTDVTPEEDLLEETRKATQRGAGGRIGVWCVTDRHTGEKFGSSVLLPVPIDCDDTDWSLVVEDAYPDAEIEIGYILKRSAWGKGIATEACRRLLRFGFEMTELDEIVATTDLEHVVSKRVLAKCGLRDEGTRRAYATDVTGFRITRREWELLG